MRVLRVKYAPKTLTEQEVIMDLLRQAAGVMRSSYMQAAKDQQLKQINSTLESLGVDLLVGEGADAGWLVGREFSQPHTEGCTEDLCVCSCPYRVEINPKGA